MNICLEEECERAPLVVSNGNNMMQCPKCKTEYRAVVVMRHPNKVD